MSRTFINVVIVKLKTDIETEGEIQLAKRELSQLCRGALVIEVQHEEIASFVKDDQQMITSQDRFLQANIDGHSVQESQLDRLAYAQWYTTDGISFKKPQQAILESTTSQVLGAPNNDRTSRRSREYLGHGIHKYKAKFFPRFVRSLINICHPESTGTILDPFCGSGTTVLEAGLLGLDGIGNDIDPLSCLISHAKVNFPLLSIDVLNEIAEVLATTRVVAQRSLFTDFVAISKETYRIPEFLRIKLDPEVVAEVETDVTNLASSISMLPDKQVREFGRIVLSHAISTKISLRWMGTGDNRFALEVTSRDLTSIATSHLKRLRANHLDTLKLKLPKRATIALSNAKFYNGSADALDLPDDSIDAVVTSPPYLPASSGRETYLRSRAPGLVALDLLTEQSIHDLDATKIVGSVLRRSANDETNIPVPDAVRELVEWMRPQRARTAKADPTLVYFNDLYKVGKELFRVLRRGGTAAMVVCTAHTFYELTSRQVVRSFPLAQILGELFTDPRYGVGFRSVELIQLELPKQDYIARPVSRDRYSETAIIFRK